MMVGEGIQGMEEQGAQFIVSTLAEAENLVGYVREVQQRGGRASVRIASLAVLELRDRGCVYC